MIASSYTMKNHNETTGLNQPTFTFSVMLSNSIAPLFYSTVTAPCAAGYYQSGNACLPCAPGTYQAYSGRTACSTCSPGYITLANAASMCGMCSILLTH